jgi:predicted enzyme related to lactoylglutathione lyase
VFYRKQTYIKGAAMFKTNKAFSSFSADDLTRASDFYSKTLGFGVEKNEMGVLNLSVPGGPDVIIYPKEDHKPASFTVLNFTVGNIDEAVDELNKRGVKFEHYDMENIKTDEKGIARDEGGPAIAWFKDPAGNILSIIEE